MTRQKRIRLWICPCCRRCWGRRKTDARAVRCFICGEETRAGRVYPQQRRCAHERASNKVSEWKESRYSSPRRQSGRKLILTPDLRSAWREVRKAKTRPNFERKASAFLSVLLAYASDTMDEHGNRLRWKKELRLSHDRKKVTEQKSAGGWKPPAAVRLAEDLGGSTYGTFNCGIGVKQPGIAISLNRNLHPNVTEMRATFVHEALHALDAVAGIKAQGHDRLWRCRLRRMLELFPPTALGVKVSSLDVERWL